MKPSGCRDFPARYEGLTKQEEIREGILTEIKYIIKAGDNPTKIAEAECITDQILNFLHSQGVVIKVDRELPQIPQKLELPVSKDDERQYSHYWAGYENGKNALLRANWKATIPLIEEANNEHTG